MLEQQSKLDAYQQQQKEQQEIKKQNQVKRQRLLAEKKREEEEAAQQLVQLDNDDFDLDLETLRAGQSKKEQLHEMEQTYANNARRQEIVTTKELQQQKKEKQDIIDKLLQEPSPHDFSTKSAKVGRFNIVSQQSASTTKRKSPRDMLEMANGSIKGQKVQEVGMRLRAVSRVHQDMVATTSHKGISSQLLDKTLSKQEKTERAARNGVAMKKKWGGGHCRSCLSTQTQLWYIMFTQLHHHHQLSFVIFITHTTRISIFIPHFPIKISPYISAYMCRKRKPTVLFKNNT